MKKLIESELIERSVDDIRADKAAWEERKKRNRERSDTAWQNYRQAEIDVLEPIKTKIESIMSAYPLIKSRVDVSFNYGDLVEVKVNADIDRNDDNSLSWSYTARFNPKTGEVKKESGSWSGLNAVTKAQIDHLKQCVGALEKLNELDYASLLNVQKPDYNKYNDYEREDETAEYDYDTELKKAQLEELLGTDKAIYFTHPKLDSLFYPGRNKSYFVQPVKITDAGVRGDVYVQIGSNPLQRTGVVDTNFKLDQLTLGDEIVDVSKLRDEIADANVLLNDSLTESKGTNKPYSKLNTTVRLKESWNSNGSLEDFDPKKLVDKAFQNKYATNSIREFNNKLLYINVDPNFIFGQRAGQDKIWVSVVEIDKDTNKQNRIYMDSGTTEDEAVNLLNDWKESYMSSNEDIENEEI